MATKLRRHRKDDVCYISLYEENERRPCTLDWDVLQELEEAVGDVARAGDIRALVIQSESPKSFVVGANIQALQTLDAGNIERWVRNGHRVFNQLQELPMPVIAKVESLALGGGLELAMACDLIVATEEARFAQPEASLGVMPGWGGSYRLAALIGPNRAKEMFFTGKMISASQAYEWGLVNHICTRDTVDETVESLLSDILKNDRLVLKLVKEIVNGHHQEEIHHSAFEEAVTSSVCMASASTKQRLDAFFSSRKKAN